MKFFDFFLNQIKKESNRIFILLYLQKTMAIIFLIALIIFLASDLYTYVGLRKLSKRYLKSGGRLPALIPSLLLSSALLSLTIYTAIAIGAGHHETETTVFRYGTFITVFYFSRFFWIFFGAFEDFLEYLVKKSRRESTPGYIRNRVLRLVGGLLSIVLTAQLLYGMSGIQYDFEITRKTLYLENLPDEFSGTKVVHISDWHLGGFSDKPDKVRETVNLVNSLNPDIIVNSGDMVSYTPAEYAKYLDIIGQMKAPLGKFASHGNHDDGRYVKPLDSAFIARNILFLDSLYAENDTEFLTDEEIYIEKNGERIRLLGINYDKMKPDVKKRIEVNRALLDKPIFTLFLFHDASYRDELIGHDNMLDVTFSGHTHGMQYGFKIFGKRFSPSQLKYEHPYGVHLVEGQYIIVSRGIGFTLAPFRVGMPPEIGLFTLERKK